MSDRNDHVRIRLFEKYSRDEDGVWEIRGEDPNCDLGGPHHEPHLDTVEGKYADIVEYALTLGGFFQWGYGGSIKKLRPIRKITGDALRRRAELTRRRAELQAELKKVNEELGDDEG